jgi:hypothetical protein
LQEITIWSARIPGGNCLAIRFSCKTCESFL